MLCKGRLTETAATVRSSPSRAVLGDAPMPRPVLSILLAAVLAPLPALAEGPLTLQDAVRRALSRDERARIADERGVEAEARLAKARAFFWPELSVVGSLIFRDREVTRRDGDQDLTIQAQGALAGTATLRFHLFDARAFPAMSASRLSRDAVELESAESRRQISFEVADAFFLVLNLEQVVRAAERRRELAQATLDDAQARLRAQLVGANDVTKAELELATARREAVRARADLTAGRLGLEYFVGGGAAATLADPGPLVEPSTQRRPPVRLDAAAARTRAEAAQSEGRAPIYGALPRVDLSGNVRATNEPGFTGRNVSTWLAADLTWELFDGGERYADRDAALAAARIARLEASGIERGARLVAQRARAALQAADASIAEAENAARMAERNAREVTTLYREGLASALDVADASARWYDAEVTLVRERYTRATAVLSLRDALGRDPLGAEVRP
jgi:outer membrane protein TolC